MKKMIAMMMMLALLIGVLAVPAMAEETGAPADQTTSATTQTGHGGHGTRQQPGQIPGQGGQPGVMPGQGSQGGQPAQGRGGRCPGRAGSTGGQDVKAGKQLIFDQLLTDGVITQEVYDAITAWMNEKMTQTRQDTAAPAEGAEPPALPEGAPDESAGDKAELLKSLLDSGVITQEQYDLLAAQYTAAEPASSI